MAAGSKIEKESVSFESFNQPQHLLDFETRNIQLTMADETAVTCL